MKRRMFLLLLIATAAIAHPGSGIAVDGRGNVYFLDTGAGVWMIDARGTLVHRGGPRFHWMAMDDGARSLPSIPGGELTPFGVHPTLILSSDVPVAVGRDGALYYPELARDGRLHIMRMTRAGAVTVHATHPVKGLQWINGIAAGPDGSLYYTEDRAVRKIDPRGVVSTITADVAVPNCASIPGNEPNVGAYLRGLAVAPDGTLYVAASGCGAVLRIASRGSAPTVVLRTTAPWSPTAVAVSASGVYALEYLHTVQEDRLAWIPRVRKILADGRVVDVAAVKRR